MRKENFKLEELPEPPSYEEIKNHRTLFFKLVLLMFTFFYNFVYKLKLAFVSLVGIIMITYYMMLCLSFELISKFHLELIHGILELSFVLSLIIQISVILRYQLNDVLIKASIKVKAIFSLSRRLVKSNIKFLIPPFLSLKR